MDSVYGTKKPSCVSEKIHLVSYFTHMRSLIKVNQEIERKKSNQASLNKVAKFMGPNISLEELSELENICRELNATRITNHYDSMEIKSKPCLFMQIPLLPESLKKEAVIRYRARSKKLNHNLKYKGTIWVAPKPRGRTDLTPLDEILVMIKLYQPFSHHKEGRATWDPRCLQEITAIGFMTLADFRDEIKCSSDSLVCVECSENPRVIPKKMAKEIYKSGFFYIGSTFYIDTRHESCIDYSAVIRDWGTKRGMGPFQVVNMQDVHLAALTISLGEPYLYMHQGNCEHIMIFSQARLLSENDSLCSEDYPMTCRVGIKNSKTCVICTKHVAMWVTMGNDKVPHDPAYFCETCFFSCNYINGKKAHSFKAYRLLDASK